MKEPVHAVVLHRFNASAGRIFDAWLDPHVLGRWMFGPNVRDERIVRLHLDPRVGGSFSFVVERQGAEIEHVGQYLEIDRPRRLVFTWATRDNLPHPSRVIVELQPEGTGCQLKLIHEMSPEWADFVDRAASSWTRMLSVLAAAEIDPVAPPMKSNDEPAQFPKRDEIRLVRTLPGPIERVWDYLTDPEKRARWFAGGTMEPRSGGTLELVFRHKNIAPDEVPPEEHRQHHDPGETMPGTVLRWEPPRVLSYTFGEASDVTFELTPQGNDVLLVLTHRSRDEDLPYTSGFASGWHLHLVHLLALLEGGPRPPFWPLHLKLHAQYEAQLAASGS